MDADRQKKIEDQMKEIEDLSNRNRKLIRSLVEAGDLPEPRPMTRKERKALDLSGFNMGKIKRDDTRSVVEIREGMIDWILENIYPDFNFDDLNNDVVNWFGEYVYAISYRDDISAKNY